MPQAGRVDDSKTNLTGCFTRGTVFFTGYPGEVDLHTFLVKSLEQMDGRDMIHVTVRDTAMNPSLVTRLTKAVCGKAAWMETLDLSGNGLSELSGE